MADMSEADPDVVWKIVKKAGVAMFVTAAHGGRLEARPLQAYPEPEQARVLFMTDSAHLLSDVQANPAVLLSFADADAHDYVALDGQARVLDDRAKIRELWSVWAKAFWDGPDDPAIRIVEVSSLHARYWDSPGKLASTAKMLAAVATGQRPDLGDSGEVTLR